jgi:hypothetical protein
VTGLQLIRRARAKAVLGDEAVDEAAGGGEVIVGEDDLLTSPTTTWHPWVRLR